MIQPPRRRLLGRIAAVWLLAAPLAAQDLGPRSFFPTDYQSEYFVDLEALRDNEFWTPFERSMLLRPMFGMLRRTTGIDVEDLDRVRGASRWAAADDDGDGERRSVRVIGLEGTPELGLPDPADLEGTTRFETATIAGHDVLEQSDYQGRTLWVSPRPGVLVIGGETAVSSVLQEQRSGGVPDPELLAFMAGPKVLARLAGGRFGLDADQWHRELPVPADWFDADDSLEFIMVRLQQDADGNLSASMHARFMKGKTGLDTFESKLSEALAKAEIDPRFRAFGDFLRNIELQRHDTDLVASLSLGAPRKAGETLQQLAMLLAPMMVLRDVEAQEVIAVPPPAPLAPPKKAK